MIQALLAGAQLGTSIYGAWKAGKKKRPNISAINAKFRAQRPDGYTTAADEEMIARGLATGNRTAARSGVLGQTAVARQARTRGLSGAAAAALNTRVGQQVAEDRMAAAEGAARTRYGVYAGNRDFEREKMFREWGSEIGAAQAEANRIDAQNATMWNSILESAPALMGAFTPAAGAKNGDVLAKIPGAEAPAREMGSATKGVYNPTAYASPWVQQRPRALRVYRTPAYR